MQEIKLWQSSGLKKSQPARVSEKFAAIVEAHELAKIS